MVMTWTSDLNTGIDVIDNQHKSIVDYINELEVAINQHDRDVVGHVLVELVDYTMSHFAFEESLLEEAGYKLLKPHKAIHDVFVKRIEAYHQRHKAGEDVSEQLHSMLCTWLVHHIKREDMAYVAALSQNITTMVKDTNEGSWISRSLKKFFD
jgi:hemerythrin